MAVSVKKAIYTGTFIHSKSLGEVEFLHETAILVDEAGKIVAVKPFAGSHDALLAEVGWVPGEVEVKACGKEQFFFPGFIGTSPDMFSTYLQSDHD